MNALAALGILECEPLVIEVRLEHRRVTIAKDILDGEISLNIEAADLTDDGWEVGWHCKMCDGIGEVIDGEKVRKCEECKDGIRWESEY